MKLKLKIERAIEHRPILLQTAASINNLIKVVSKIFFDTIWAFYAPKDSFIKYSNLPIVAKAGKRAPQ